MLAHELRTPLSVLQGYIRLLQRRHSESDPDGAMLGAMLEATGKLSAIARQASELGLWLQTRHESGPIAIDPDALGEALTRANQRHVLTLSCPPSDHAAGYSGDGDTGHLASALLTLADALAREAGCSNAALRLSSDPSRTELRVDVTVAAPVAPAAPGQERRPLFGQGGLGLSLISASWILDASHAALSRDEDTGAIRLSFPLNGGAS